jgi:hypothetical protein
MNFEAATKHPMDWIYRQVHPEDRPNLSHEFLLVESRPASEGDVTFQKFFTIRWVFGVNVVALGYATAMVDAVKDPNGRDYPETMLRDLKKHLGVRITEGEYDPEVDNEPVNPVGEAWPEKGDDIYHPVSGLSAAELASNWTDERGSFVLRAGNQWMVSYWYYRKVA